ncbi:putative trna pseudouridine synthase [Erysiphe necator]|uniref:tRNA pseudouridine synthase 1 n=1 Tax=Uncinula necator TaxID=52586 RepID=A0A0B1P9J1_UNCNE|nr:putative trna pseudouridine synthase [Erysiphe necator]
MVEEKSQVEPGKDASSEPYKAKSIPTRNDDQQENLDRKDKVREKNQSKSKDRRRNFSGGESGRGHGSRHHNGRQYKGEFSRAEWSRDKIGKRKMYDDNNSTQRKKIDRGDEDAEKASQLIKNEVSSEERRPKRKVAVMIGYAGTGYKGMQINVEEKTIEGDIFKAFVASGAISKANADDPKKSSLVRCARTDKGVHAAGNVISLKLIVEDNDIVQKINENLPSQIRVWGYERTSGGFSCYQSCDSRWYEYMIPSYSFLPPHPNSYLGRKLIESATSEGYLEKYLEEQEDVSTFWENAMEIHIKPILDKLDSNIKEAVLLAVHKGINFSSSNIEAETLNTNFSTELDSSHVNIKKMQSSDLNHEEILKTLKEDQNISTQLEDAKVEKFENTEALTLENEALAVKTSHFTLTPLELAIREVKDAYTKARKLYRISSKRRARIQEALNEFLGTHNFYNYTVQKKYNDPSAKRVIKSFDLAVEPVIMNQTEWLSIKVHGQSFMMHQIRKMIAMIALVIRCATPLRIIQESYGPERISIPKAPGLGLLLERPVFNTYNQRAITELHREAIDFDKYKAQMDEFKQKEIYERIFREEERDHQFSSFFNHLDHYQSSHFLWVTASGISAVKNGLVKEKPKVSLVYSEDEGDINEGEG